MRMWLFTQRRYFCNLFSAGFDLSFLMCVSWSSWSRTLPNMVKSMILLDATLARRDLCIVLVTLIRLSISWWVKVLYIVRYLMWTTTQKQHHKTIKIYIFQKCIKILRIYSTYLLTFSVRASSSDIDFLDCNSLCLCKCISTFLCCNSFLFTIDSCWCSGSPPPPPLSSGGDSALPLSIGFVPLSAADDALLAPFSSVRMSNWATVMAAALPRMG